MYGVLSADITFIGLFICTLIISVVFHRLNETSPLQESQEQQIKDFTLEGVDKDNTEISQAIENLKQEQTKILTIFKKDIYSNQDLLSISEIKKNLAENKIDQMKKAALKEIRDASVKIAVDSVKKIITTSVDSSKLDTLFQKNLDETKEELKKINS